MALVENAEKLLAYGTAGAYDCYFHVVYLLYITVNVDANIVLRAQRYGKLKHGKMETPKKSLFPFHF